MESRCFKGLFVVILAVAISGCATSTPLLLNGSNNSKSHILYEHRTPIQKTAIQQAAEHGVLGTLGFPSNAVWDNAGEISLGAADIVKAITKVGGFPFSIIPQIMNGTFKGMAQLKEETSDQEVSKLYYTDGMKKITAEMADRTKITAEWVESGEVVAKEEPMK